MLLEKKSVITNVLDSNETCETKRSCLSRYTRISVAVESIIMPLKHIFGFFWLWQHKEASFTKNSTWKQNASIIFKSSTATLTLIWLSFGIVCLFSSKTNKLVLFLNSFTFRLYLNSFNWQIKNIGVFYNKKKEDCKYLLFEREISSLLRRL